MEGELVNESKEVYSGINRISTEHKIMILSIITHNMAIHNEQKVEETYNLFISLILQDNKRE